MKFPSYFCRFLPVAVAALAVGVGSVSSGSAQSKSWKIGTPIVTYWAGPPMGDAVAEQMKSGGFNLVWCGEKDLDLVQRHGLRAQLQDALLASASLDNPTQQQKLDDLIARVSKHPALYSYFITDEPSAKDFPALGRLVAYLHEKDPAHLAYINLFPTYANNDQLGTSGDTITAYRAHLDQFVQKVRPALISYDHYQFSTTGDSDQYFLNLGMIRELSLRERLPFLNIVQAATWTPSMRVPGPDEMRYLVYTTLAYGAQGISYYVYCCAGHTGGIANPDGSPTALYPALKELNRDFVSIALELQPLKSLGVYHCGMHPQGTRPLPADAPFRFTPPIEDMPYKPPERVRGVALGFFGSSEKPTHVLVVNLDYKAPVKIGIQGPRKLREFNAHNAKWTKLREKTAELELLPGGGRLIATK